MIQMEKMTWLIRMKFVQLEDLSKENQNTGFIFPVENKVATIADFFFMSMAVFRLI